MTNARALFLLAPALSMASCAGPRPGAPLSSRVAPPSGWRTPLPGSGPVETRWWVAFGDPVLTRLVDQALRDNMDIAQAAARVEQSRALARLARANRGPELDGSGSGTFTRSTTPRGGPIEVGTDNGILSATWDTDLFGRLRNLSRAARATLLASAATRDAIALSTASTTAQTYIALLGLDAQLKVTRETLETNIATVRLARRLADAGYTSRLELRQAEVQYQTTQALIPTILQSIAQTENALTLLVGSLPTAVERGGTLAQLRVPQVPEALPSSLLRRRPDIYAAEESVVAADRTLDSSRAAMLPDFSLSSSLGGTLTTLGPNPTTLFSAAGSIFAPIFDSGRLRATADESASLRDEAAFAYRAAALQAFSDVENALVSIKRIQEEIVVLRATVITEVDLVRIARDRYDNGYTPYSDLLDAQRLLLQSQLSLASSQTDLLNGYVSLFANLGGGWTPTDQPLGRPGSSPWRDARKSGKERP